MSIALGTSYIKDYSKMSGKAKQLQAMMDVMEYLGEERFNKLHEELVKRTFQMKEPVPVLLLSIAGIQGYPATAWCKEISADASRWEVNDD